LDFNQGINTKDNAEIIANHSFEPDMFLAAQVMTNIAFFLPQCHIISSSLLFFSKKEIYALMEKDPFQRFKASSCFSKLLETVGACTKGNATDPNAIELEKDRLNLSQGSDYENV
jgi:hypothetical protein